MRKLIPTLLTVALAVAVACVMVFTARPPAPVVAVKQTLAVTPAPAERPAPAPVASPIRFTQISPQDSGVDCTYFGSPTAAHYMTEQNGGGISLFDVDEDGRLDLFFSNGSDFKNPAEKAGASQQMYRQTDNWKFEDITLAAGLEAFAFGQGSAAGDYDNDGFCDLFVAGFGANRLWHNNGDGTFSDVTQQAGVGGGKWGTSAAFADLDDDGNAELYVVNYVDWKPDSKTRKQIASPMDYEGQADLLFKNLGDGRFEEIGATAGIAIEKEGKGLALAISDLNGDRRPDIYIANDTTRNFLFRNLGGLKFEEVGIPSGCAVSEDGNIGSSMGIAISDYNHDGLPDMFVTNFAGELLDVFTGSGQTGFIANNSELGIDPVSKPMLNFGIVVTDLDADTWLDLFFTNGHLWDAAPSGSEYKMRPNILRNVEGKRFVDVSRSAGTYFQKRWLGRAAAMGDLDNDGDHDLVVGHLVDPAALLRNDSDRAGNVLWLRLVGTRTSRQALGVCVEVRVGSRTFAAHVPAGESFQVSHDPRILVATADANVVDEVRVWWSHSEVETFTDLPVGKLNTLVQSHSQPE